MMLRLRRLLRVFTRSKSVAAVIVLTFALAIGANTVVFSFVRALLLTPLPFAEPERLVRVLSERGGERGKLSVLEVDDLNHEARLFEGFASFRLNQYTVTEGDLPEVGVASINTYNLFDLLGVEPFLGETWPQSHDRAPLFEIVLSHRMWERRFGADRMIVGKSILLDGGPYTVLGVMPPEFL
ncbi:MAG TPA: ABC transporter permease, partial [Vicinamibacteria bacterium]